MVPFFRRRRKERRAADANGTADKPPYRRDDEAVEYGRRRVGEGRQTADERKGKEPPPGFRPLPRCPRCGTAMGFDQRRCHSCGMKSTGR